MKLSVVTVNWNAREALAACLSSAREALRGISAEHWVVDNASSDGSADMVAERFPEARLIRSAANEGFGRACNRALAAGAAGEHVLFLNPDTVSRGEAFRAMLAALDGDPSLGAVTCALTDAAGRFQEAQGHRLPSVRTAFNTYFFLSRIASDRAFPGVYWARPPAAPAAVEWISGAAMMVRRAAMPPGPFFDEAYFLYAEDMEASLALRRAGWKLLFLPQASLTHHVKASVGRSPARIFRLQVTSQTLFLRRHLGAARRLLVTAIMAAGHGLRALVQSILSVLRPGRDHGGKAWRQLRLAGYLLADLP